MNTATLIDFGSTFTKSAVVSLDGGELIFKTKTPSTVKTDARIGLEICLEEIKSYIGSDNFLKSLRFASSSAAGGLRMIVIGLTPSLSMMAGKNAAYGAGAKVIKAFSYRLTDEDLEEIIKINPEIILLCGGYEGGNASWTTHNAKKIAECGYLHMPVIYAGNSSVADEVRFIFKKEYKECMIASNIIPDTGLLNVEPAVEAIRNIFMKRIVNMKGFDKVKSYIGNIVMPTPAAVLAAGKLLAKGTKRESGIGNLMIIDIGGATTDIHSFAESKNTGCIRVIGSAEPYAKRTVEGDLGVRESCNSIIEASGIDRSVKELEMTELEVKNAVNRRIQNTGMLASSIQEQKFDRFLAMESVRIATRRHAGKIFSGYGGGVQTVQQGKDLRTIEYIIGTGGPIINSGDSKCILENSLRKQKNEPEVLLPQNAHFLLDKEYILYAAGLLANLDENIAIKLLKNSLINID